MEEDGSACRKLYAREGRDRKGVKTLNPKKPTVEARRFSLERPYSERQQIVVVPDEVIDSERLAQVVTRLEEGNAEKAAESIIASVAKAYLLGGAALASIEIVVRGVMKLRERGVDVKMVGATEATELVFAPGHPFEEIVYVGHPGLARQYYPIAEFHRRVFEQKFCEAVDLVMALGASKVSVERREGYGKETAAELDVPLTPKERIGGKLSRALSNGSQVLFEADLPGGAVPRLPNDMVWFQSERTWQTMARARIEHRTERFSLMLRYENDYGITTDLKSSIEGVKLGLGGKFNRQENTVWRIDASFPPVAASQAAYRASGGAEQPARGS